MLEATNSLLAEKEKDLEKHKSEMSSLQSEKAQVKQYRLLLDNLEREKKQLEAKVVEMQKSVSQSQANANNDGKPRLPISSLQGTFPLSDKESSTLSVTRMFCEFVSDPNHHRLVEEKEFTQGQIDFLNSVIVDLHGKNDDLKARIEILEMGISPADANDMHLVRCADPITPSIRKCWYSSLTVTATCTLMPQSLLYEVDLHISHSLLTSFDVVKLRSRDWVVAIDLLQAAFITALFSGNNLKLELCSAFSMDGIKPRMVAPRLFCDICDVFDIHDTEDCPRQASSDSPPLRQNGKSAKTKAEPRPYCEICEVFGHDTANCDDAETF
ncbi:unnamed protein product [Timema podura]|uniref:CLIP1 zinc knuckle domain-containing protein n=1 Tax=Timema podura TaxID=61482 RepID=A0ABN7NTZ5_TIMPD|nr:unnamed protein product [Timema podura]